MDPTEKHTIRLPGQLLERIQSKETSGDYDDSRFESTLKKRKGPPVSRKERRKQERSDKRQKKVKAEKTFKKSKQANSKNHNKPLSKNLKSPSTNLVKNVSSFDKPMNVNPSGLRIIKEDDLDDDEFSDFDDNDEFEEEKIDFETKKPLKKAHTEDGIRIVKEDDLHDLDDEFSDFANEETNFDLEDYDDTDGVDVEEDDVHEVEVLSDDEDPLEKLRKLKQAKSKKAENPLEQLRKLKEAKKGKSVEEHPLEQLRKLKEAKKGKSVEEDPLEQLRRIKEAKKKNNELEKFNQEKEKRQKSSKKIEKPVKYVRPLSGRERELMERDEQDMEYYAKKLGLKQGKKSKLSKQDEFDDIGGLLDGLDFDLSDVQSDGEVDQQDDDLGEEQEEMAYKDEEHLNVEDNGYGSEFDEEELRELREMEALEDSEAEIESSGETHLIDAKENPYVAPVTQTEPSNTGAYIPPSLRRKMALEANQESEEVIKLNREIKGSLNRLSEANASNIIQQLSDLYSNNARLLVTESITKLVMESILSQGRLNENLLFLQSVVIAALHKTQGVEFGAYFIQTLIEKLDKMIMNSVESSNGSTGSNESLNLVALLSAVYTFQLVSSRILYDVVKLLIDNLGEYTAELLLKLIQNSGNQMRSDDPSALKEIILLTNKKATELGSINSRMQFLIETISNLKNNKLKQHDDSLQQLIVRLKKLLGGLHGKASDPLQVSLDDIRNIETRGKWWLVGSAWKGNELERIEDKSEISIDNDINDILDNAEPNWLELARAQRMNTDIRRAVFVLIMSANDYMDAFTRLDKLGLKRAQEREIPRVLLHCASVEPSYNPYYGVLAAKLCDGHSFRKTLQFMFWDLVKEFESGGDDRFDDDDEFGGFDEQTESEVGKLSRVMNLGRLFGYLIGDGCLALNILRTVNFVTVRGDMLLFVEILLVTFLDTAIKKSKSKTKSTKSNKDGDDKYDFKYIAQAITKAQEQPVLLQGIKYFVGKKLKASGFITGRKQKARVECGSDTMCSMIDEVLKEEYNGF